MMFNYFIVVMIFSSLYMSRGQTINTPLNTTRNVENTEEPRTTPKGKRLILSFCLFFFFFTKFYSLLKKVFVMALLQKLYNVSETRIWQNKGLLSEFGEQMF